MRILSLALLLSTGVLFAQPRLTYSTFFGGSGQEVVRASTVDAQGRIWVTGYTQSSDLPTQVTPVPFRQARPGGRDIFLVGIDPTKTGAASLFYATYIGGTGNDEPTCIAAENGELYIGGFTNSIDFPLGGPAVRGGPTEGQSGFVLRFNPTKDGDESMTYSTYLGGGGFDRVNAIAVRNGFIYVAGYTTSTDFPKTPNAFNNTSSGNGDAFLTIINSNGLTPAEGLNFSTYLSGVAADTATAIGVSATGEVFVAGMTASADFLAGVSPALYNGSYQSIFNGGTDAFLLRVNANRSPVYATYFGGSDQDAPMALAVTGTQTVVLGGYTLSTNLPTTDGAPLRAAQRGGDAFVARFNLDNAGAGQLTFSTLIGGPNGDVVTSVSPGPDNTLVVGGYTLSDALQGITANLQEKNGGAIDAFVARLDLNTRAITQATFFGGASVDHVVGVNSINACEVAFAGQTQSSALSKTETAFQGDLNGLSDAFLVRANLCRQ